MNGIHHKIDHFWLFTDCRWKLFDGRCARTAAQQPSAPNWRREDKPGAVSRLAFMGRGGEETGYFCIFPDNLPTNMGPPVRGSWINLTSGLRWGWRGENNCEYIFGTQFIALFIHFEPFNLLEKWFFSKSSVCKCPVCSQFIFPIAACQLRCELVVVFCPNSYC